MSDLHFGVKYLKSFREWIFILSALIYPLTAIFIVEFNFPNTLTNIILKLFYLAIYIYIILFYIFNSKFLFKIIYLSLLLFFFVYSIRLIWDISFRNIPFASGNSFYVYSYFFGATIVPSLALILSNKELNFKLIYDRSFLIVILSNILLLLYLLKSSSGGLIEMFSGRSFVSKDIGDPNESNLINPIIISRTGAVLVILVFNEFFIFKKKMHPIFLFFLFFVGIINVILGASRGPFIFLIICLFLSIFKNFNLKSINLSFIFKSFLVFLVFAIIIAFLSQYIDFRNDIFLFQRLTSFYDDRINFEKEDRDFIISRSLEQFKENPIFGDQYVERTGNGYPHNILIEVLMSTGLIGGLVFLHCLKNIFYKSFKLLSNSNYYIFSLFLLCFFFFLNGLTSGSIFVNPEIWVSISLLLSLPHNK